MTGRDERFDAERDQRFETDDAKRGVVDLGVLLLDRERAMVRRNDADRPVDDAGDQGLPVGFGAKRGVEEVVRVVPAQCLVGQQEMLRRGVGGDVQAVSLGVANLGHAAG